jgi:hypothetical protein
MASDFTILTRYTQTIENRARNGRAVKVKSAPPTAAVKLIASHLSPIGKITILPNQ